MIWLNSVYATPLIGIRLKINFENVVTIKNHIPFFINKLYEKKPDYVIQEDDVWGFKIDVKDGYTFKISYRNILAQFDYIIQKKITDDFFPKFNIPQIEPYDKICNDLIDYLYEIFESLKEVRNIEYDRIGIVANAVLNEDTVPPGLVLFIKLFTDYFQTDIVNLNFSIRILLDETETHSDYCLHTLNLKEKNDHNKYILKLDWQREYKTPQKVNYRHIKENVQSLKKAAYDYFEKFGEGDIGDDKFNSTA